ncbi:MAG: biotin synthase BioB, partial [Propionibacterium sp.]
CFGRGNHERARQAVEEELDGLRAAQSHDRLDEDGVPIRLRGAGTARVPNV